MTPKEKAESLVERFCPHVKVWDCYNDEPFEESHHIDCALICVDEMINYLPSCEGNPPNLPMNEYDREWWQQVKEELTKMK